jgi:hypothetical protein
MQRTRRSISLSRKGWSQLAALHTDKLSVHVGLSCGEVCFGILGGDEGRFECLVSGPCLTDLSSCLEDADRGVTVISASCAKAIQIYEFMASRPTTPRDMGMSSCDSPRRSTKTPSRRYKYTTEPLSSGNYKVLSVLFGDPRDDLLEHVGHIGHIGNSPQIGGTGGIGGIGGIGGTGGIGGIGGTGGVGGTGGIGGVGGISIKGTAKAVAAREDEMVNLMMLQFSPLPIMKDLLDGSDLSYLSEIREVTTLFSRWDGYEPQGRHRDLMAIQECFLAVQRILHNSGGFLRQFLVDDKGCVLIACWGVPTMYYLDNAHRALSGTYTYAYTYTYTHTYIHICTHMYSLTHSRIHSCIHTHTHTHTQPQRR